MINYKDERFQQIAELAQSLTEDYDDIICITCDYRGMDVHVSGKTPMPEPNKITERSESSYPYEREFTFGNATFFTLLKKEEVHED